MKTREQLVGVTNGIIQSARSAGLRPEIVASTDEHVTMLMAMQINILLDIRELLINTVTALAVGEEKESGE